MSEGQGMTSQRIKKEQEVGVCINSITSVHTVLTE